MRTWSIVGLVVAAVLALPGPATAGPGPVARAETEPFEAGRPYTGTFADPTVLRVGSTYYASATTTANLNLPVMTSTDLVTWTPRPPLPDWHVHSRWSRYNDAMTDAPAWAAVRGTRDNVTLISQWAPSLARFRGRYLAAYSAAVRLQPRHSCIGVATSSSPIGPYTNAGARPLVCFRKAPLGAIDPQVFVAGRRAYLLWKKEGVPGKAPPRLVARRLAGDGTSFARRSRTQVLLARDQRWEGGVVENPSMIRTGKRRYLLLYSGNAWRTAKYATGYAVCRTPLGPCRKPTRRPLLRRGTGTVGTGGADVFRDTAGRLRMAYAAFDAGAVGEWAPRRLHVATLRARRDRVRVVATG